MAAAFTLPALPPGEGANSPIIEPLWQWTQYSLQNHLHENATFLAERVHAEHACDETKLLLATCHYAAGAANRAVVVLQGCAAPQNRYLLALCCMRLGRLPEAQVALLGTSMQDTEGTAVVPNGAAGLYLMGMICVKMQQRQRATKYLTRCLGLNPFMWSAYEALSQLGAPLPEGLSPPPAPPLATEGGMPLAPFSASLATPCIDTGASTQQPPLSGLAPPGGTPHMRTPQMAAFTPALDASGGMTSSSIPPAPGHPQGIPSGFGAPSELRSVSTPSLHTPGAANAFASTPAGPGSVAANRRRAPGAPPLSAGGPATGTDVDPRSSLGASGAPPPGPGRRGRALGVSSGVPVRRSSRLSSSGAAGGVECARAIEPSRKRSNPVESGGRPRPRRLGWWARPRPSSAMLSARGAASAHAE